VTAPPGIQKSILERSEDVRCEIGKLLEECCNVRAFDEPNLAGRHVEGRLEIIFQLSRNQLEASAGRETAISGFPGITNNGLVLQIVTRWGTDGNERPVFVHQVELMDTPKQIVPAVLRLEGSHHGERIGGIEGTILYFSILRKTFELFPRFVDWEAALTNFCLAVSLDGNGVYCGASDPQEMAKRVHDGNGNDCGKLSGKLEFVERFRALRMRLMSKVIRLRFSDVK
jgi:hypothetical protein